MANNARYLYGSPYPSDDVMATSTRKLLPEGIYTPLPTFFDDQEDLDLTALKKHVKFIALAGTIPVLAGSMGEAVHLSHDERSLLIVACRSALDEVGLTSMPIVAGVGAASTRETIELANGAAKAGADFVMVIPPGYYAGALNTGNKAGLKRFFIEVAEASPVPCIIYNFPAVSGGIDLDSDFILDIVRATPNVCGAKLTCVSVGKITRITAVAHDPDFQARFPRREQGQRFQVIDGLIDILLPSVFVGSSGAISGLPNFAPLICVRLWELCQEPSSSWKHNEAKRLQGLIALADGVVARTGVSGMKQILHRRFGYGRNPRKPLMPMSDDIVDELLSNQYVHKLMAEEERLLSAEHQAYAPKQTQGC